ncbi:MAG: ribulose-phosphate 3-epimerase [Chlamydiae bacterium]|nr:MAG: ribulose-phosphate 3-epimerase [Chlamydiota bacterium]
MTNLVSPSILAADFSRLAEEIATAKSAGADLVHVDVMDGHFVPNITIGVPVVASLKKATDLPLDVHLMIDAPDIYAPKFVDAGADIVTIHVESPTIAGDIEKTRAVLEKIRSMDAECGVVVKPNTPAEAVFPFIDICKMILVMTVEPGFGGQSFMADMMPKVKAIRDEANKINPELDIEIDGGINQENAELCCKNGANIFVAGTYLFGKEDIADRIAGLHNLK